MAVDAFLKLDGVEGESKVKGMEGQIQILDINFGIDQPPGGHFGMGSGVGKANFRDLQIAKRFDLASPTLMGFCADGKHIKKGEVILRKAAGDKEPMTWLSIMMENIFISLISPSGLTSGEGTETLQLNFDKVHMTYTPQEKDGTKGIPKEFSFSPREVTGGPG